MKNVTLDELCKHNLLETLVRSQIIAEEVSDYDVDCDKLEEKRANLILEKNLTNEEGLQAFLAENSISEEIFEWQISLPLRIQAHCNKKFLHKAEARFLARKNQLDVVSYSLVRVRDRYLARELYFRLEAGESSFADLALKFSDGPESKTGGRVGPTSLSSPHPVLAERLRVAAPGELFALQITDWSLIVRLETYSSAIFDDIMAMRMAEELFNQWVNEEARCRIKALKPFELVQNSK